MTRQWLAASNVRPESLGAMRFFLQPQAAPDGFTPVGKLRRREVGTYSEFEYEIALDAGSLVGVIYSLPEHGLLATSFGTSLQPIRSLIFGPMSERGRAQILGEFDRSRPTFMAAIRDGLVLDFRSGGFLTHTDPNDGIRKVLLAFRVPEADIAQFAAGTRPDLCEAVLAVSIQVWHEALQPINASVFGQDRLDWEEAVRNVGAAAKWLIENAEGIRTVLKVFGVG